MTIIEELLQKKQLRKKGNDIVLARPTSITFTKKVIDEMKSVYKSDREYGGVMSMRATEKTGFFVVDSVTFVQNDSDKQSTSFNPNPNVFNSVLSQNFNSGALPLIFHTHPTNLGLDYYDKKRTNFFVGASPNDKAIASQSVTFRGTQVLLPECIFVAGSQYSSGFKLGVYQGGILPSSYLALSRGELIALVFSVFSYVRWGRPRWVLLALVFVIEEYRRPQYDYLTDGSLVVRFRSFF